MGTTEVPTLRISGLTAAQRRAYVIADNRLAGLATAVGPDSSSSREVRRPAEGPRDRGHEVQHADPRFRRDPHGREAKARQARRSARRPPPRRR